jgi:hypothetical protein
MNNKFLNLVCLFVIVTNISFAQWVVDYTPNVRVQFQAVVKDNKIFCIGGNSNGPTNTVDIYDTQNESWLPSQNISTARAFPATVVGDSAIYAVGGIEDYVDDNIGSNRVDIYKNETWYIDSIPEKIWCAQAVHVGNKILIAGSIKRFLPSDNVFEPSKLVHVYDELTGVWSIDSLSQARSSIAVATDGNLAIFAGGKAGMDQLSNVVDIYNATTNTWSTASLSEARMLVAGVYANGKFYFAGGAKNGIDMPSAVVDIYDGTNWTTSQLSFPRAGICAVEANNRIFFTGGGFVNVPGFFYSTSEALVDEFDIASNTWSDSYMNYDKINHSVVSHNNKVYVIGGLAYSISSIINVMEIKEVNTGLNDEHTQKFFNVSPNPSNDKLVLNAPYLTQGNYRIEVINSSGILMFTESNTNVIDVSALLQGLYFIKIITKSGTQTSKFIKN